MRILSAPPSFGTGAGRQGACLSRFGGMGHLPVNGHRDCNILVRVISGKFTNIHCFHEVEKISKLLETRISLTEVTSYGSFWPILTLGIEI